MKTETGLVTELLLAWGQGDAGARERLLPLVYDDLRRRAARLLRRERPDHTLQPTALVHEAFLRLVEQRRTSWRDRGHFLAVAGEIMRRVLVDHARKRKAAKRGRGAWTLTLEEAPEASVRKDVDLVALDDALRGLAAVDARKSQIVELRYFAGLSLEETAEALEVSLATVKRDWAVARAWLFRELRSSGEAEAEER